MLASLIELQVDFVTVRHQLLKVRLAGEAFEIGDSGCRRFNLDCGAVRTQGDLIDFSIDLLDECGVPKVLRLMTNGESFRHTKPRRRVHVLNFARQREEFPEN